MEIVLRGFDFSPPGAQLLTDMPALITITPQLRSAPAMLSLLHRAICKHVVRI